MRALATALLAGLLLATGCTTRVGDLTIASPKNIPSEFDVVKKGIQGKDCSYVVLLFIPVGTLNPTIDGAIDDALAKVEDADALVNTSIHNDLLFTLLFNYNCIRVDGDAVRTR